MIEMERINTLVSFAKIAINKKTTQADVLADRLKDMVASGELQEGYQFPNETEFCRLLGVGRGTLREAYTILETCGYIDRTKHGTYVKNREVIAREGNFVATLKMAGREELYEFILALEPEATFLAAKRITDEQLAQLYQLHEECKKLVDEPDRLAVKNRTFHEMVRNISGNQLIISALSAYYEIFNEQVISHTYRENTRRREFLLEALSHHEELLFALKNHDQETARKVTYEHLLADIKQNKIQNN